MKETIFSRFTRKGMAALAIAAAVTPFFSCDRLREDLQECPHGARIRFVYDYNMEFANAFPSQVDCLTVLFYDEAGHYVATRTNTTDDLKDENWRMEIDLEPGTYNIIAYGGMECPESSFSFTSNPASIPMSSLEVELNSNCLTSPVGTDLHDLFYGKADVTVERTDMTYREVTVYMMKDTNNLRIMLQQVDGSPIDEADFDFKVVDDNTLMAWDNAVIPTRNVDYLPWVRGNASPGDLTNGDEATVCYAEFSFPRLVTSNAPRLVITRKSDSQTVIDIPLINYLLLLKSEKYSKMGAQEFLDRESRWKMLFFLQNGRWYDTVIEINDWIVRINHQSFS